MPAEKDLEFFSYRSHLDNSGFSQYLKHFPGAGGTVAVGEATASYFWTRTHSRWSALPDDFQTDIPKTVYRHLGEELKLLVTLRNPVTRAVSAYLHYLAVGEIAPHTDFVQAMTYGGVVDMGFYARHLRNWLAYYPRHQIRVLILETDIQARPVETLAGVCRFLCVSDHDFTEDTVQQPVFAGTPRLINENGVFVAADESLAGREDGGHRDDAGQYWRQVISADGLQTLHDIFLADVEDLDLMLGTKLAQCWGMTWPNDTSQIDL